MSDVNQIDVLRARAIASMPSKQKLQPRPVLKQPELEREEGELSSSDDEVSLSSLPTGGGGLPPHNSTVGGCPEVVFQENVRTARNISSSNVVAASSTTNVSIVNKLQLLSGLSASAPSLGSMKSPVEVGQENSGVSSHKPDQPPQADVDKVRSAGGVAVISEKELISARPVLHSSPKQLSVAAPVFRPAHNSSLNKLPLSHGKKCARPGDVVHVPNGTTGLSFISPHRPFSPPFAASHRSFSHLSGPRPQPVPFPADRTEADEFLAGLNLPGSNGSNANLIINFDDSDSEGEQLIAKSAQVQSRSSVDQAVPACAKTTSLTQTPPNKNSDARSRVERTDGMSHSKKTTFSIKAGPMARPASVSKLSPRTDEQIENLRLLIARKENEMQRNRFSQLPESRIRAATGASVQGDSTQTPRTNKIVGNKLAVKSANKTQLKKKAGPANAAFIDLGTSTVQASVAELGERSTRKVGDPVSIVKTSDHQVSTGPSDEITANQQAEASIVRVKESVTPNLGAIGEVRNLTPGVDRVSIAASTPAGPSPTVVSHGTVAATSIELVLSGIKNMESGERKSSEGQVIKSGVTTHRNGGAIQIPSEKSITNKAALNQSVDVSPIGTPELPGRNGAANSPVVVGELHLESSYLDQAMSSSLKRPRLSLEDSTEQQKDHQLDRSSNIQFPPLTNPSSGSVKHLDYAVSRVANQSVAIEDKLCWKRQKIDEYSQHAHVTEIAAGKSPHFSSPAKQMLRPQSCPPGPSTIGQVEDWRGESRSNGPQNLSVSASDVHVDGQKHLRSQNHCTQNGDVSSGTADMSSVSILNVGSGLVQPSTSARFKNSLVRDSQLIPNGGNIPSSTELEVVLRMHEGGLSCGWLQPLHDLSNADIVTTADAAGFQVMNIDRIKMLPPAFTSSLVVPGEVPDKILSQNNQETVPASEVPGGRNPSPSFQQYDAARHHLEHFSMHNNFSGGSASFSLEKLREEEDIVDKDLEEAQVVRRQCEIRERELRKAYRDAQIALSAADTRCEALRRRQKFLSVQVQNAELHIPQQPSSSIHSGSLVPYDNSVAPRTDGLSPAYPSIAWGSAKPSIEQETDHHMNTLGNVASVQQAGTRNQSSARVDRQNFKKSSSSADTEILEESIDKTIPRGIQLSVGHAPSTQEVALGDKNIHMDVDEAPDFTFCAEGEVSASINSGIAASSQKQKSEGEIGTLMPSTGGCQDALGLNNLVYSREYSHEDHVLRDRSTAIHKNQAPFTSTSSPQLHASRADTAVDKKQIDVLRTVSPYLKDHKALLCQGETRTVFGNDQTSLDTLEQEPFQNGGEIIRSSSSSMRKPTSTDEDPFVISKSPGQDLSIPNALGNGTEGSLANLTDQDMNIVGLDSSEMLPADPRSTSSLNCEIMTTKHNRQDDVGRKHQSEMSADTGLKIRPRSGKYIFGLRALAENFEMQQLDPEHEETSNNSEQTIRSSLKDLTAEGWTRGSIRSGKHQSRSSVQAKVSEISGDKGDCASRTSDSSEGESRSLRGEEGRQEVMENGKDEVCLGLPRSANSAENHPYVLASEGDLLVGVDSSHGLMDVVQDDQPEDLDIKQLPSTVLSIGFIGLGTGSNSSLCLGYNHVATDKRSDDSFRVATYESPLIMFRFYRMCAEFQTAWHKCVKSQTWSHMLDPCKPLCIFEHRGKCNDDSCPWQHVADYTLDEARLLSQLSKYFKSGEEVEEQELSSEAVSFSLKEIRGGTSKSVGSLISNKSLLPRTLTWSRGTLAPSYKIGAYLVSQDEGFIPRVRCLLSYQYRLIPFTSCALSSAIRRPIHLDMPFLPTNFSNVDSQMTTADASGWRYTGDRSLAAIEKHVDKEPEDIEAWLELALTRIDFDLHCTDIDAYNEALCVLSRALEANPTVATLWVVYIGLFYQGKSEIGEDDLFFHAIQNSKGSYELLLLYINSRTTLSDRLRAYEVALEALVDVGDRRQDQSAYILDVIIQMLDFMCVAKVTHQLHTWAENFANPSTSTASLLVCLTPEDRCIMMVACAYAIAFGQLSQHFLIHSGCKQQMPWDIDWSRCSHVQKDSKDLVLKVMEAGMRCVAVFSQEECEQVMAVNYLKCLALYNAPEAALRIGREIVERHPTCVELVLVLVRLEKKEGWIDVFKHALQISSKNVTGLQRLWYQCAVHMLDAEGSSGALDILYQCGIASLRSSPEENSDHLYPGHATRKGLQLNTRRFEKADSSCPLECREAVFAWMNLALFEMLSGNMVDAQFALEKSMKAAVLKEDVMQCWKEMTSFIRFNQTGLEQANAISDLLDKCSVVTNLLFKLVPLASKLLNPISRRRVRVFLESLIGSASVDHSLINSVVEIIISKERNLTKEVATIVEALMETFPGNYGLVLQIYRMHIGHLDTLSNSAATIWISSLLFGSLLQACPQACEQIWVEAGDLLAQLKDEVSLCSFYQYARVLHPFSGSLKERFALFENSNKHDFS
uniref:Putative zinc-finger domain-containing protein n=1 Tax=Physcomitrium patens TaxID=3218 RepID=A0A2K1KFF5_PHYPA|nr:hypothetical protein PHYPA_008879 [Physcomitrium patens]